ncbi:MAG: polysaccharide biosynthesis/export family protein, partial [Chloroflexota bacterium]
MIRQLRFGFLLLALVLIGCASGGDVVTVKSVNKEADVLKGLEADDIRQLEEAKKALQSRSDPYNINQVIQKTQSYTVEEYLRIHGRALQAGKMDYRVGGMDVLDITVYEEQDLTRKNVRVSSDGYITFPLIGRVYVENMTTNDIENTLSRMLSEGGFLRDAHVAVMVTEYKSKQYMVLGSVKTPGTYPLTAQERVLDAISRAGGIDFEKGGNRGMVIRTENPGTPHERKIVIRIDLPGLMKGGNQLSNIVLTDKDLLYIPPAEQFFIIGQVEKPGSYLYKENEISLVEAISMAGGFTRIAARNRTRIIRVEDGVEKIIEVRVDEITDAGKKAQDVIVKPGDVIVIP